MLFLIYRTNFTLPTLALLNKLNGIEISAKNTTVVNALNNVSTTSALSANQGKVLNDTKVSKVAGKGLSTRDFTLALLNKLNSIENTATADMTARELLTAIRTVDGAGSGLDADKLDGLDSTQFLRSNTNKFSASRHNHLLGPNTVGVYAMCINHSNVFTLFTGAVIAGNTLRYAAAAGFQSGTPSGTWRCLGRATHSTSSPVSGRVTIFQKISP